MTLLRDERCPTCISGCAGEPIRCQAAAATWLIDTITAFGGTLRTAHAVVALWLDDPIVSPIDGPRHRDPRPVRQRSANRDRRDLWRRDRTMKRLLHRWLLLHPGTEFCPHRWCFRFVRYDHRCGHHQADP